MSTNKKNKRIDELKKISGGLSINGSIPAGGKVALEDSSDISNTRPNNYEDEYARVRREVRERRILF